MLVFTGQSALEYWNRFARINNTSCDEMYSRVDRIPQGTPGLREALLESEMFRNSSPVEVMVSSSSYRNTQVGILCKVRPHSYPRRSFCKIDNDVFVISPALLFVEMATRLDFASLVKLGNELTGLYAIDVLDERGFIKRDMPLIKDYALISYLKNLKRHNKSYKGLAKALRASKFVLGYSESPMETRLAILLTLPRRLDGFGLPAPVLNHEIALRPDRSSGYKRSNARFDLFWSKGDLDVEYDSDQFHALKDKLHEDSMRRNAIMRHGYKVVTVTSAEFFNSSCMADLARTIARAINYKLPPIGPYDLARIENLTRKLMKDE